MDTQRLILFFVFSFSLLLLWTEWEKERKPKPPVTAAQIAGEAKPASGTVPTPTAVPGATAVPIASAPAVPAAPAQPVKGETISIRTDLLVADVDTMGAALTRLELLKHKETDNQAKNLVLLGPEHQ